VEVLMDMAGKRALIAVGLVAMVALGLVIVSQLGPETVWIEESGKYFAESQKYDSNSNQSFSITFRGVEFVFHYWIYPNPGISDLPNIAHFTVRFQDGLSENLTIAVGGFVWVAPDNPLLPILSNHTDPTAGVATAHTEELWGNWVYLVSV
jgi:hypothetical protein